MFIFFFLKSRLPQRATPNDTPFPYTTLFRTKRAEAPQLSHMIMDILTAKPELAKTSTGPLDRPLPSRPTSLYGDDQAYADLSRAISGTEEFGSNVEIGRAHV